MATSIKKLFSNSLMKQQLKKAEADYLRQKDDHVVREKDLIVKINRIFSEETRLNNCLNNVLLELSLFVSCPVAEAWLSSIDHKELRLTSRFVLKGTSSLPKEKMKINSAHGLVGKAWMDKVKVFMNNSDAREDIVKSNAAHENVLVSGTAIPILMNDEVVAVISFFNTHEAKLPYPVTLSENVLAQLASDIKRKKVEEEHYQFFTLSPDLLSMSGIDGFFKKVNPSFTKVLGFAEKQFLTRPLIEFVYFDDRPLMMDKMAKLAQGEIIQSLEVRFIAQTEEPKWISWSGSFLQDEDLMFCVGKDITEKKKLEISIAESEERFRIIFEQAAIGVAMLNSSTGELLRVNHRYCDIFGYSHAELDHMTFMEITHPDDLAEDLENMERLRKGEIREFTMEKRHFRKDGSVIWVNLSVSPMWKVGESPTYHIAIVQDISERKAAEKKAGRK